MSLVEITQATHPVLLELLYATDKNFTGKIIYKNARCFLHEKAMPLFEKAVLLADRQGYTIKIFDTFRPKQAAQALWDFFPNSMYVADPQKGSNHTRGVAIDLNLVDKTTGKELDMGTPFDDFTDQSHHSAILPKEIAHNRYMLLGIMMSAGWDLYNNEWWHYQLFSPRDYPLIEEDYGIMGLSNAA
ncbi:MAG: D-alanyl-D-alanine dipeptidase [Pseudomonadota bacterium]|jgi:D-alanyl-D-alanine dipeptidase|nr:D-alanyl-D-alanine dipeptidase [Alphaproteobacteria bacterium]